MVRAGKTRAIGFSEIAPSSLRRAAAVHPVAAVQSEYSLATRAPDLGLVQACAALGTALVAFSPVGRALLTDAPPTPERIAASEFLRANPRFIEPNLSANLALTDAFRALAAEMGTSAAALAIAWLLSRSPGVIPIPGTRSEAHLRELAAGAALALSAGDLAGSMRSCPWAGRTATAIRRRSGSGRSATARGSGLSGRGQEEGPGGIAAEGEEEAAPGRRAAGELEGRPAEADGHEQDAHPERAQHGVVGVDELLHGGPRMDRGSLRRRRRVDKGGRARECRAGSRGAGGASEG